MNKLKLKALSKYLEEPMKDLEPSEYGDDTFAINRQDYMVLTDEEANTAAKDYIKESLWAFNADFIIDHSDLPYESIEMIKGYQESKCEGANETIEALITDIDEFVDDAICADGRGHFLNTYDDEENEITIKVKDKEHTFYIYRIN